ncbi:MAG: GH39 family glycosyl hydrolase [Spirochaetales bacterium]
MRLQTTKKILFAIFGASLACSAFAQISVDTQREIGAIDRRLFSLVNYQFLYGRGEGKAITQFEALGPGGTQARIEMRINEAEPENDNNNPTRLDPARFFPERAIVYAPDTRRFMQNLGELEIEPMALLAYNAPWLAKDGRFTGAPSNNDEWVEFAVEQIRYLNAIDDAPDIAYVEVWNEPNIEQFWTGTQAEYFELFNAVADALHTEFPGIQVGGPVLSPSGGIDRWLRDFIEHCGERADFLSYHTYGQSVEEIVRDIETYAELFRRETGKTGPRILISESDHRLPPAEKFRYLVERQLALLDLDHELIAFHHFTLPYYEEGAHVFGLIDVDAVIVGENYWPYWAFRDFRDAQLSVSGLPEMVDGVAARSDEGAISFLGYNSARRTRRLRGDIPLPGDQQRVVSIYEIGPTGAELLENRVADAGEPARFDSRIAGGNVLLVTAKPLSVQEDLVATISIDEREVIVGTDIEFTMSVRNIGSEPLRGRLLPVGQPSDWEVELYGDDSFRDLMPGETFETAGILKTTTPTELNGAAVYTFVSYRKPKTRTIRDGGFPVRLQALAPLAFDVLPLQTYASPGNRYVLDVEARNTFSRAVAGDIHVDLPNGWSLLSSPSDYTLPIGTSDSFEIGFQLPAGETVSEDAKQIRVSFEYAGTRFTESVDVFVRDFTYRESVPIDLTSFQDSDLFTREENFGDVHNFGGPFSYPAKFYPSDELVNYLGVDFLFPDTRTGKMNGVRVQRDEIPVPLEQYESLAFLSAATNGDKSIDFELAYEDGSRELIEVTITDWCVDVKHGETEICRAPYRHNQTGVLRDAEPRIVFQELPVNPHKRLEAVVLPAETDYWIVAMSLTKAN